MFITPEVKIQGIKNVFHTKRSSVRPTAIAFDTVCSPAGGTAP
jgi:hypothetical protein